MICSQWATTQVMLSQISPLTMRRDHYNGPTRRPMVGGGRYADAERAYCRKFQGIGGRATIEKEVNEAIHIVAETGWRGS